MQHGKMNSLQDTRVLQVRSASIDAYPFGEDELMADADEPPDERRLNRHSISSFPDFKSNSFHRNIPAPCSRTQSMLTSMLMESERNAHEIRNPPERGMSTCSNASIASTADLTSDGLTSPTRTATPSPPLPPTVLHALPPTHMKPLEQPMVIRQEDHPVQQVSASVPEENNVEAGLGRKRCIKFACGRKESTKPETAASAKPAEEAEPPKRRCMIKWASPTKASKDTAPVEHRRSSMPRRPASPAPNALRQALELPSQSRNHRDSDSTVRNDSPRTVRKSASVSSIIDTKTSVTLPSKALSFHEFDGSEPEDDAWTKESTCHRSRLTINDTLKVENQLRKLGEEAEEEEEEALENEEALDNELNDEDEDAEGNDDDEDDEIVESEKDEVSDDGFQTDDEEGFAGSDDESDADSDYRWWEPGRSTAATSRTSVDPPDLIRPRSIRSMSESSVGSVGARQPPLLKQNGKRIRRPQPLDIHPNASDLPDSTDFVCGTLDEDRPLEEAYLSNLERRRAAKHKLTPQDFDPTFPHSDPEMDEEDEEDQNDMAGSDSDQHYFMHGSMEQEPESLAPVSRRRSPSPRRRARSPPPPALRPAGRRSPPARLRSPPPPRYRSPAPTRHRSPPPPRRLFGTSPRRLRSPPPATRLRSPLPSRRTSLERVHRIDLAERPKAAYAGSLPRPMTRMNPGFAHPARDEDDDDDVTKDMRVRGAIDIVKGLERKKQLRKQKLSQKNCSKQALHPKEKQKPNLPPGKGAERMRLLGMQCAAKAQQANLPWRKQTMEKDMYMASL